MTKKRLFFPRLFALFLAASLWAPLAAVCQPALPAQAVSPTSITALNDRADLQFPGQVTFRVDLAGAAPIKAVTLEYGVDQLTCGTVIAKVPLTFTPARSVKGAWTWKMADSGSLPPGALSALR